MVGVPQDRYEQARAALADLEQRLAAGEPVGRNERRAVNMEYQAAEAELNAQREAERLAQLDADGAERGSTQVIGGEA